MAYNNFLVLKMLDYHPGVFATLSETETGKQLWEFLNSPEAISGLEMATTLGHPAVEGIEEQLLEKFGKKVMKKRIRQMIGHMVRQVLEHRGYIIAQQNVKITNGAPFSRATRYKRPNAMTFHVHRNIKEPKKIALTADKAGSRLPEHDKYWRYWKSFKGELRGRIAFDLEDEMQAREDITQQGFHIYLMTRILSAGGS